MNNYPPGVNDNDISRLYDRFRVCGQCKHYRGVPEEYAKRLVGWCIENEDWYLFADEACSCFTLP